MEHVIVLYYDEKETHIFSLTGVIWYQFIGVKQTAGGQTKDTKTHWLGSSEVTCCDSVFYAYS